MIFNNIAVMPNEKKDPFFEHTKNLINYLLGLNAINVSVDEIYKQKINNCVVKYMGEEDLYKSCDLLIALGGDGTILRASAEASRFGKPVIGVNLGRIGFMSEIELHEIHLFGNLFSENNINYAVENRMMIDVEIIKDTGDTGAGAGTEIMKVGSALNDAVITNGVMAKLIEIDLFSDGAKITHYRADGVIIATPTGSTGYSMSAGGPVIDPNIACLCVTPICSHSLINRPIIFSHDSVLEVRSKNTKSEVYLTVDGRLNIKLDESDTVRITKSKFTAKFIRIKNNSFFDVIREKISEN